MSEIAGKRSVDARITRLLAVCAGAALLAAGCGGRAAPAPGMRVEWIVGRSAPGFDPDGPPDALRESLERLLSRGLTDDDTSGTVFPAAADSIAISGDRLTYTFRLPAELRFAGGQRCTAADFRVALEAGLTRTDHGTRAALLAAVRGMDAVRARRALPPLGIETPDSRTLVIRLARPDSLLLRKLSLPGVSTPWRRRAPGAWSAACGIGPFRVASSATDRWLVLVRDRRGRAADTLRVRFVPSAPRVRTLLRAGRIDLLWPPPGGLLAQPLPPGYHSTRSPARPARDLLLVMRADVPPTTHPPARQAIAHALHRGEVAGALEGEADAPRELIPGAAPFELPKFDAVEVSAWLDRGHFGRSFHVTMAYDADGFSPVARALQGGWSRFNLYVELKPLRGAE
ncbi:MAG: hypothetical protein HYR73_00035, partial [Candidatus Eisenbacteria bacterium]|nr:hypothetical protein [Candidatus Eisenbacteria bacterium]